MGFGWHHLATAERDASFYHLSPASAQRHPKLARSGDKSGGSPRKPGAHDVMCNFLAGEATSSLHHGPAFETLV